MTTRLCGLLLLIVTVSRGFGAPPQPLPQKKSVLRRENLVAWCIVPFDAKKRGPAERAAMLEELGLKRCAYDWRAEHVPTFEQEILEYRKHGIEYFAFWSVNEAAFKLFKKYKMHPQIWEINPDPKKATQEENVAAAVKRFVPLAKRTREMGCKLGLYNHGGWGGEPKNLVAVCKRLREMGYDQVGIVYNFHHGHGHMEDWAESFALVKPYLLCLNLDGMNDNAEPKILGIGKGRHELEMIRVVVDSGYDGPIGILDHRPELDAGESLLENRDGLEWVRKELAKPGSGGAKPATPAPAKSMSAATPGHVYPGAEAYRRPPITVECEARLPRRDNYNILVASDTKRSGDHWEVFSMRGSGLLTAYLPGYEPDHVRSGAMICDGKPHAIGMIFEPERVRLYLDGKQVADQTMKHRGDRESVPGGFAIGRLVEGGIGCTGAIAWVRVSKGIHRVSASRPERDDSTVGLWDFANGSPTVHTTGDLKLPRAVEPPYDAKLAARLAAEAAEEGDPVRGAAVFSNAKQACLSCHRVGKFGGTVGPELTAVAKDRKPVQIVESVLWPKREVKPEFVTWQVLTSEGQVLTGYKGKTDDGGITIRDVASGKVTRLDKDDVEDEVAGSTVMPAGLTAAMSRQQQLDLFCFLSELGRDGQPLSDAIQHTIAHSRFHGPAKFPLTRAPIDPARWPNATQRVNRDRIYDFYTKQAEYFRQQPHVPMLLAEFPGLDGGVDGHWGNQSEPDWADGRWNETELGSVQAGVFRGGGLTVPRGVCVRLGDEGELSACFNPDRLTYDAVWKGGFVGFSPVRHGFVGGIQMQGQRVEGPPQTAPSEPFVYHGFYRYGKRVVFSYRIGDVEYLDAPWAVDGKFVRELAPVEKHSLRKMVDGGAPQWPENLETKIVPGGGRPYAVDTIELPFDNPWKALLFCSGQDFLPDGSALVCTMQGDVWHVSGLDGPADRPGVARWRRFAAGLHYPLGLVVSDGRVYVQCRDQLTRLTDVNGDGEADFYECVSNAFVTSPAGHDFICGLQRDAEGNFYTASGNQGLIRISSDGRSADVVATGFRNPDGVGLLPDGTITVPCSEGEWTPASMICAVRNATQQGPIQTPPHFGYRGPIGGKPPELPLVYLPRGLDNSSGGQVYVDSDRWGPLAERIVHLSFGAGTLFVVLRDEVDDQLQGAVVPLAGDFRSGVHRGRFRVQDGQLYVSGMSGWGSYTPDDGCFQRVRYTGEDVQVPVGFHVYQNGVRVTFSQTLDASVAGDARSHFAQCWNYRYSGAYGSPEFSPMHPGVPGHDPLAIASAHVLPDERSLFLEIPDLQPVNQLHLRLHVNNAGSFLTAGPTGDGHDLFVTVHKLDQPFTEFEGYRPRQKTIAAHPLLTDMALNEKRVPNPWFRKIKGARRVEIRTGKNLTYETREFEVKAGEPLEFRLTNPDVVPHNWVLVRPGALQTVGELANRLIADPDAFVRQYIPHSDAILAHTDIVSPGESQSIFFRAPAEPGRYPYLCTFPGHWMVMNGVMVVK